MGMLLTRKDFKYKNELLYGLTDEQQFDYFTLVQGNAAVGAKDDEISEEDYIFSRLIYGFKYCDKLNNPDDYKRFIEMKPPQLYISELVGINPELYEVFKDMIKLDFKNLEESFNIMSNMPNLVTLNNYKEFIDSGATSYQASELFIKCKTLHSTKGLVYWVSSKPISRHIENVLSNVREARHKLIIQLYVETRGEKKYSPIIKEVAKEQKCESLLKGFVLEK